MPQSISGDDTQTTPPSVNTDDISAATSSGTDDTASAASSGTDNSTPNEPATMADAIAAAFDQATAPTKDENADDEAPDGADADADAAKDGKADADGKDKSTPNGEETGTAEAGEEELPDPSQEELNAMHPRIRRRVKQLLDQRRAVHHELIALKPAAESYQTIRSFMQKNNLADQEVAELFQIGADLKSGDPTRLKAFVDRVMPRVQQALEATGQRLPTDLQGRVESGEMTEDAAREFAQVRYQATVADNRAKQAQQQAQTVATTQVQQSILQAVNAWHEQTRKSDPDFDLKTDAMTLAAQAIVAQNGHPTTPAQALEFAKAAYDRANAMIAKVQPQRAATRPTPNGSTASANRSGVRPAPTSLADAIGAAFDQATRG